MLGRCYRAELSKILKGKGIYIALAVVIVVVLLFAILSSELFGGMDVSGIMGEDFLDTLRSTPREDYATILGTLKSQLDLIEQENSTMWSRFVDSTGYLKARISILEFLIANENVSVNDVEIPSSNMFAISDDALSFMLYAISLILEIVIVYAVIMMSILLAGEYRDGTLKMQLLRANSRRSILTGKWLAVLTLSVGLMAVGLIVSGIYAAAHFKTQVADVLVVIANSHVSVMSSGLYIFLAILFSLIALFAMMQFGIFMASISRYNRSISMAIPIVVYLLTGITSMLLQVVYLGVIDFPYCLNLISFLSPSEGGLPYTSLYTALPVLMAYIAIFTTVGYVTFDRTEL